ncbi:MAG: alpha/beta fold hydrolase [Mycobacteriales bacterium]|nr:alpha/beta fold hydrolase [Mycobacteriales bacterium]
MPVLPGAEPIDLRAEGPVGVLISHGFTGCPQSVRGWAEHLHTEGGLSVRVPLLPGHGTRWQDMNATGWSDWYATIEAAYDELRERCATVFVMGLSMGGTLALRVAEQRSDVAGVVTVNASLATDRKDAKLLPVAKLLVGAFPGIGSDIKKPGPVELAYPKLPLKAAHSFQQAWPVVRGDLQRISCPVLAFRSAVDHVVPAVSGRLLLEGLAGKDVEERVLEDSYHVATLDNDAPRIFAESLEFVTAHAPAGRP